MSCDHNARFHIVDHSSCLVVWCRDCGGLWQPGDNWTLPNNVEELIPVSGDEWVTPTEAVAMKYKAENQQLKVLLQRAVPLAAWAQDIPRHEAEAIQWHHDAAVALEKK